MPDGSQFRAQALQLEIAQRFAELLTNAPDPLIRLRFIHDSDKTMPAHECEGTLGGLWPSVVDFQTRGYGVFYFMNNVRPGEGCGHGGCATDADVVSIRALATDHDSGIPDDWEWHVHPKIIVRTSTAMEGPEGHGEVRRGQALWPVPDCSIEAFRPAQQRLAAGYGSDRQVCNPSRVLRLPGTLHLKNPAAPQLVTFEDCADCWTGGANTASLIAGLPELPAVPERGPPSAAAGNPIVAEHLRRLLGFIDPGCERDEWRNIVAAIRATPVEDDPDEEERRQIAREWSRGELDRRGRYRDAPPANFDGDEAVDQVFDTMPPKAGGVGFGTIFHAARAAGYDGPPGSQTSADAFQGYLEHNGASDMTEHRPPPFLLTEQDIFDLPDPEELVAGLLMKGENVCFYGPPKVGKTFIALDIALSLAADLPVFGHVPIRATGPVVYLSGEGHGGMKRRIKAWRKARGIAANVKLPFYYKAAVPQTAKGIDECRRFIDGIRSQLGQSPVLLVIDTMARSMAGLDENQSGDAGCYLDLTESLRSAFACTVLTLAHRGKNEKQGIRGSSAFTAGFDAIWQAEMNASNRTVKLEAEWLKDAEGLGPFCFRLKLIQVEDMKLGNGAVLEYVPLSEFTKGPAADAAQQQRRQVYDILHGHGAFGIERCLSTRELAELRAGPPPRPSEKKAYTEWETRVALDETHLDNCSRERHPGKRPLYEGYYGMTIRPGGKRPVKVWFLPEPGGEED